MFKKVILNNSDFLVLATDLNPKSFHLIDNKDFKEMKKYYYSKYI